MKTKKPVLAIILDGLGIRKDKKDNPLFRAKMPFFNSMLKKYPNTTIYASEQYVGLPAGQMGNSEVGHLTLGAGRVLDQDLMRINKAITSGELSDKPEIKNMINRALSNNSTIHLVGMVSDGGVHGDLSHLLALLDILKQNNITKVFVHAILDGRDTPVNSGRGYLQKVQDHMTELGIGRIATIIGRFYAMDRENRYNRTQSAFNLFCNAEGDHRANSFNDALDKVYFTNTSDEYCPGFVMSGYFGMNDLDEVFFFNFRPDRMRQLSDSFISKKFTKFKRGKMPKLNCTAMCQYDEKQTNIDIVFKEVIPHNTLSQVLSNAGLKQLKLAETTKYAHVTYYFNGGVEVAFPNEDRILIESKNVENFADYPPMRAPEITDTLASTLWKSEYDFILVNFSNCDMIGHTGNMDACIQTLEILDKCLQNVVSTAVQNGYTCFIIADHGNIEDEGGVNLTTHTLNPVPFIVTDMDAVLLPGEFALDSFAKDKFALISVA